MYVMNQESLNDLFVKVLVDVYDKGDIVVARGQETREFHPVLLGMQDPMKRTLTVPGRKVNPFAATAEFCWIMAGMNELTYLSHYLKNAIKFSDDGKTWRAGYGPRLRRWPTRQPRGGVSQLPDGSYPAADMFNQVDQFKECLGCFNQDLNTRRAVMMIFDPEEDYVLDSKDIPCTNWMHFMVRDGKLDLNVVMRSNDIIWGWSAVNVFNFTLMQELMAGWLEVEVGTYYHMADSFHLYEHLYPKTIENLNVPSLRENGAAFNVYDVVKPTPIYDPRDLATVTLNDFDQELTRFMQLEDNWRSIKTGEEIDNYEVIFDLESNGMSAFLKSNLAILAAYSSLKLEKYSTAVKLLARSNRKDMNVSCLEFLWRKVKGLDRKIQTEVWASYEEHHKDLLDLEGVTNYILEG